MALPVLTPDALGRLQQVLYPEAALHRRSILYAVLDAARDPALYRALHDHEGEVPIRCLYQGDMAMDLAEVAPYLVALDRQAAFTIWLLERGWGQSWGIFVRSREPFDDVRRHFRKLTVVSSDAGKSLLFRFYDPRVLRTFMPIATPEQRRHLFGGLDGYAVETEGAGGVLEFTMVDGILRPVMRRIEP